MEEFDNIANNEDWIEILFNASEFMRGGSKMLRELENSKKAYEVHAALGIMDEYYDEEIDDEEKDRKIIADAISDYYESTEKQIQDLKEKAKRYREEYKKGRSLKLDLKDS
jgi:hypothetical protein